MLEKHLGIMDEHLDSKQQSSSQQPVPSNSSQLNDKKTELKEQTLTQPISEQKTDSKDEYHVLSDELYFYDNPIN